MRKNEEKIFMEEIRNNLLECLYKINEYDDIEDVTTFEIKEALVHNLPIIINEFIIYYDSWEYDEALEQFYLYKDSKLIAVFRMEDIYTISPVWHFKKDEDDTSTLSTVEYNDEV